MKLTNIIETEYDTDWKNPRTELKTDTKLQKKILQIYFQAIASFETKMESTEMYDKIIKKSKKALNSLSYTREDITQFSTELLSHQDILRFYWSGIFISALIHIHHEEEIKKKIASSPYIIITEGYEKSFSYLGIKNSSANIYIQGNCNIRTGAYMNGGLVHIFGNTGNQTGYAITGGKIIVEGNTQNNLGEKNDGGYIHIKGNVGDKLGEKMQRGRIDIDGTILSLGDKIKESKQEIYQRGIQITDWRIRKKHGID